jgi:hypothetical protein
MRTSTNAKASSEASRAALHARTPGAARARAEQAKADARKTGASRSRAHRRKVHERATKDKIRNAARRLLGDFEDEGGGPLLMHSMHSMYEGEQASSSETEDTGFVVSFGYESSSPESFYHVCSGALIRYTLAEHTVYTVYCRGHVLESISESNYCLTGVWVCGCGCVGQPRRGPNDGQLPEPCSPA